MAKDLSQFLPLLSSVATEKGLNVSVQQFSIDTGMDQGSLDLYCLGATTCKLGEDLAIWKHGIAESGEIIRKRMLHCVVTKLENKISSRMKSVVKTIFLNYF